MKEFNKKMSKKSARKRGNNKNSKSINTEMDSLPRDGKRAEANLKNESPVGNPNWYFTDHELAEQASRFSFQSFIGNGQLIDNVQLPSMCIFALNPSVGAYVTPTDSTSAVNLVARKLYSQLSNKSGRTAGYAPQDVMTLILAMGEVVSYAAYLRRAFGLVYTYNQRNRDLPTHLIQAMGINAEDLYANLAAYRVRYNTVLNMANKIPIPANITWFQKCEAIYQGVFTDSPDEMAQLYAFIPATTWIIKEGEYEGGTILKTTAAAYSVTGTFTPRTMSSHITTLSNMINALLTSSTYNIIYADILNYASSQNVPLLHLGIVDELYSVIPAYDPEVLLHIHNMMVCNFPNSDKLELEDSQYGLYTPYNDVYPSAANNNLVYMPIIPLNSSSELEVQPVEILSHMDLVDFPYGNPDLTQRIEATRFSARLSSDIVSVTGLSNLYARFSALADHWCVGAILFSDGVDFGFTASARTILLPGYTSVTTLAAFEKFRYAPLQYRIDSGYTALEAVFGELNFFTRLDAEWLDRLNSLCYQGLFELR